MRSKTIGRESLGMRLGKDTIENKGTFLINNPKTGSGKRQETRLVLTCTSTAG